MLVKELVSISTDVFFRAIVAKIFEQTSGKAALSRSNAGGSTC